MVQTSGFGWNNANNMVTECNDVWMKYVKANPKAESMHFKIYTYFIVWCDVFVFGKECATGEGDVNYSEVEGHMNEEFNVMGGQTGGQNVAQIVSQEDVRNKTQYDKEIKSKDTRLLTQFVNMTTSGGTAKLGILLF